MRLYAYLAICLLAFQAACDSPTEIENPAPTIIATAYLTPGRPTEVSLRQTLPPERYYDGLEDTLANARVEIRVDDQTYALSPDAADPGLFRVDAQTMAVEPGKTYHLLVSHGDRQVRARTLVPFKAEVTRVIGDTITYFQQYGDLFGDLAHPGEFYWSRSENAAGYVVIVEAVEVRALPVTADPLTADLDTLIAQRQRLQGQVSEDSLAALERRIEELRQFFAAHLSLVRGNGEPIRYLRDREQEDWDKIERKDWSEGKKWRERRGTLFFDHQVEYWIPADSTRSDFWWLGVRFEGEYQVRLQAVDRNYFDYFTTSFNGQSGSDGDKGPLFHVEGGIGVFGSYVEDSFRVYARRGEGEAGKLIVEVER
jgi:hypothetical protein